MVTFDLPWVKKEDTLVCFGDSITASPTGYVTDGTHLTEEGNRLVADSMLKTWLG